MSDGVSGLRSAPRAHGQPLEFLYPTEYRHLSRDGVAGFYVNVRLASYRSLPISCVQKIELSIDGAAVDPAGLRLVLDGNGFSLEEAADRTDIWWYILDVGQIFVPTEKPLSPGRHVLDATLTTIMPFATVGRSTSTDTSQLEIEVPSEARQ